MLTELTAGSLPLAVLLAQFVLAGVFTLSAVGKLLDPERFVHTLLAYRLLPPTLARPLGRSLPYGQLAVAGFLLWEATAQVAAAIAALTLVGFMASMGLTLRRGIDTECGCFGLLFRERIGWQTIGREGGLLSIAALLFLLPQGWSTSWPMTATPLTAMMAVLVALFLPYAIRRLRLAAAISTASASPLLEQGMGVGRRRFLRYATALAVGGLASALSMTERTAEADCHEWYPCDDCYYQYSDCLYTHCDIQG